VVSQYVARARLAGRIRRARSSLSETSGQLSDIGLDDVLFQLTNVEVQLEEIYLQLMHPLRQHCTRALFPMLDEPTDEVPF
jgi:hypothetical protein